MKNLKIFALAAFALLGFAACQQEELVPQNPTHTVTFVAGAPETTKTTVAIDGTTAKFAWTAEDAGRFTVYENGEAATRVEAGITDGVMSMLAEFSGNVPSSPKYQALFNSEVSATQIVPENSYAETTDVMVSEVLDGSKRDDEFVFRFKREVAFAKMTLKGLTSGAYVSSVKIESDKPIAGKYDLKTGTFIETSNVITLDVLNNVVEGNATVWFTTIPVEDANFTVTATTVDSELNDAATYTKTFAKTISLTRGDVKPFSVAMEPTVVAKPWVAVDLADIDETMPVVITMATSSKVYALSLTGTDEKPLGADNAPKAIEVTVADGKLSADPDADIIWNIANNGGDLTIYPDGVTDKWLYVKNSNDGVRLGTNTSNGYVWSIDEESGYLKADASSTSTPSIRYLGVYTTKPDWRSYTNTTGNTKDQTLRFYSNASSKTSLAAPTNLVVSAAKGVSWDAVANAGSYTLTIGSDEFSCPSNSFDASAISDEYYDVAVVAVPSDIENYKKSAPATFTDVKFGTPTLPIPTLSEGVIEETSVAFSWTKDTRATNGYHWALYNGETLVKEATETSATSAEVTELVFGTTYTAKVYAVAVDGEKPYAQSSIAKLDLTTKAKTTISTIVEKGTGTTTYAISDLTVMAVSGSNYVVKDETGVMFCYKTSGSYTITVGDVVTLSGTYEDYQGLKEFKTTSYTKTSTAKVEHETASDLNVSNVAAFVENPDVRYVKANATVAFDGSLKIGDVAVYQYGNSLASYAGRTINLYGYTLGYNTSKTNIVLLQTSVEIDQTVPYLAIDQTSKTWASDNKDPFVVNVTVNTTDSWTVSTETLDWATIVVNNEAGTITVTPKDANTTEKAREAKLKVSHSAGTLSETITLTQNGVGSPTKEPVVIILDAAQLNDTATTSESVITAGGVTFVLSKSAKQQKSDSATEAFSDNAAILIGKSGAYIYNKTAIPGKITKFEIYANAGASKKVSVGVNFSSSAISKYNATAANTYTQTLSTLNYVYDCSDKLPSDAKYFWYQVTNANNSQVQFRITYIPE